MEHESGRKESKCHRWFSESECTNRYLYVCLPVVHWRFFESINANHRIVFVVRILYQIDTDTQKVDDSVVRFSRFE